MSLLEILFEPKHQLRLSRLKVKRRLGEGGFGQVFEVQDCRGDQKYALKVQRKTRSTASAVREAVALHALSHAFIIRLVHVFHTYAFYCILMELCDRDLNGRILECVNGFGLAEGLPSEQVKHYTACITLALEHIHQRRIVFRDLKPENILTTPDHRSAGGPRSHAKLADFGLARSLDGDKAQGEGGQFFSMWTGTWAFMPQGDFPEGLQVDSPGKALSLLAGRDWFAMGCCLLLMLLGERGGHRVYAGHRAVLLPPPHEEIAEVVREAADAGAVDLVLALTAASNAGRATGEQVRSSPFTRGAVLEAELTAG